MSDPITISSRDSAFSAVDMMRAHGFARLPVVAGDRALEGYVRLENIMEHVLRTRLPLVREGDDGR